MNSNDAIWRQAMMQTNICIKGSGLILANYVTMVKLINK